MQKVLTQLPRNFIKTIIDSDIARSEKKLGIKFRFPPEPNGYLHIGHAKAIAINFLLAEEYNADCILRFDDTNPLAEKNKYYAAIINDIKWLGWEPAAITYSSDYFNELYSFALKLIKDGKAYVDKESAEVIKAKRGSLTSPGTNSAYRDTPVEQNLELFDAMKKGIYETGEMVLRAKIDMASPNVNMRDPVLYRILNVPHHRIQERWSIYPMYDFAHPLSDYLENITYSLCTLEFEDHRPLYKWFLKNAIKSTNEKPFPYPRQIEFARLNLAGTITSKREISALINSNKIEGWDDPRLATLSGLKRRGHLPAAINDFCIRTGISKASSTTEFSYFENISRNHLNQTSPRAFAVIDPVELRITNLDDSIKIVISQERILHLTNKIWVDRDDVRLKSDKNFFRLSVGNYVKLRYGYVIKCTNIKTNDKDAIEYIEAHIDLDTKNTTTNKEGKKVKGIIHWVPYNAEPVYFRFYSSHNYTAENKKGFIEPMPEKNQEETVQFERLGYFKKDTKSTNDVNATKNNIKGNIKNNATNNTEYDIWIETTKLRESKNK